MDRFLIDKFSMNISLPTDVEKSRSKSRSVMVVMVAGGARAQRARTWSHGCNTARNLRGRRGRYRRDRFGGSPIPGIAVRRSRGG